MVRSFVLAVALPLAVASCATVVPAPVLPPARSPAPTPAPIPAALKCTDNAVSLEIAERFETSCYPESCPATLSFRIASCADADVTFSKFALLSHSSDSSGWELADARTVSPHTRSEVVEVPTHARGDYVFRVTVDEGSRSFTLEQRITLVDVVLEHRRAVCIEGGGEWHAVGLLGTVICDETMPDAGARCSDESECRGRCELVSQRPWSRTMDRVEGRCTRYRHRFGCHAFIGATQGGLVPKGTHSPRMCVD